MSEDNERQGNLDLGTPDNPVQMGNPEDVSNVEKALSMVGLTNSAVPEAPEPEHMDSPPLDQAIRASTVELIRSPKVWGLQLRVADLQTKHLMVPQWQVLDIQNKIPQEALMPLTDTAVQALMDQLWREGYRPTGTEVVMENVSDVEVENIELFKAAADKLSYLVPKETGHRDFYYTLQQVLDRNGMTILSLQRMRQVKDTVTGDLLNSYELDNEEFFDSPAQALDYIETLYQAVQIENTAEQMEVSDGA